MPNAPVAPQPAHPGVGYLSAAPGQPLGFTESGVPIMAPTPQPKTDKKGRTIISAADLNTPGARINERGESLDKRGKKAAYLAPTDPNLHYPRSDPMNPFETGGADKIAMFKNAGGVATLQRRYEGHRKAMDENRDDQGAPAGKLPDGYFEALGRERGKPYSKTERDDIMKGIEHLRQIDKGTRT